jgi:hypothetical protein
MFIDLVKCTDAAARYRLFNENIFLSWIFEHLGSGVLAPVCLAHENRPLYKRTIPQFLATVVTKGFLLPRSP